MMVARIIEMLRNGVITREMSLTTSTVHVLEIIATFSNHPEAHSSLDGETADKESN